MKVRDKELKKDVNVMCKDCPKFKCYWARPDPGSFSVGRGYKFRSNNYLCGHREIHGCPEKIYFKDGNLYSEQK